MRTSVAAVHALVESLVPGDEVEARHRTETLSWLSGTDDVFRRVKPATPDRHLVSYLVPMDPADGSVFLVDHVNAGLWLPPGGHVEPDEHPGATARREAYEELGIGPADRGLEPRPVFLTVTRTVGLDHGHTDVSLWFRYLGQRDQRFVLDRDEFRSGRWWSAAEVAAADPAGFDPHLHRFLTKVRNDGR